MDPALPTSAARAVRCPGETPPRPAVRRRHGVAAAVHGSGRTCRSPGEMCLLSINIKKRGKQERKRGGGGMRSPE